MTHMTNGPSENQTAVISKWLSNPAGETHDARQARHLKRESLKAMLDQFNCGKFKQLRPDHANAILSALNLPVVNYHHEELDKARSNPTTGLKPPANTVAVPIVGKAFMTPLARKREELRVKAQKRLERENEADAQGQLWTAMASYTEAKVFILIRQGRVSEAEAEAFHSQHTDAWCILEPTPVLGKLSDIRGVAAKQFAGKHRGDVTIRVIQKGTTV